MESEDNTKTENNKTHELGNTILGKEHEAAINKLMNRQSDRLSNMFSDQIKYFDTITKRGILNIFLYIRVTSKILKI